MRLVSRVWSPWVLCMWKSPVNQNYCILSVDQRYRNICNHTNSPAQPHKYVVFLSSYTCDISFTARRGDHGIWSCMVTSAGDLLSHTTFTDLSVLLRPQTSITLPSGERTGNLTSVLRLEQNQTYHLTCTASQVFPR